MSSTFLDMQRERDVLVRQTFPALRAKFRARGVELLEVDLRWGITQEQSENGQTLPTLLAEIDRCRPYFIGLLGERYGWVPPENALTDELKAAYPSIAGATSCSVTELEIIHGVLSNPEAAKRAVFFERDPAWLETRTNEERAIYVADSDDARAKLADLKARIRASGARIIAYANPDDIGPAVEAALADRVEAQFPEVDAPDAFTQTARLHAAYARERRGLHIGAGPYMSALDAWIDQADAKPMLITGASGGGKSTLVANWLARHRTRSPNDIVFEHYLGASPDSADPILIIRRLWEYLNRTSGENVQQPADERALIDGLPQRLALAHAKAERSGANVLIVLDGLDKLSSQQDLRWLPTYLPPRVHLLSSSLDGAPRVAAEARDWATLDVKPLADRQRREFIDSSLRAWGRALSPTRTERILGSPLSGSPLFLKTLLDELRVAGIENELNARLDDYLAARDIPDLFGRVLQRLESDCGADFVRTASSLVWASRAGLEERLIGAITGATPLAWATLRNNLGDALRDQAGRVTFSHDYLRQTIETRYLPTDNAKRTAHLLIADQIEWHGSDGRQAEELPYQLRAAKAWQRLETVLVDLDRFQSLRGRGDEELLGYWLPLMVLDRSPEVLLCGAFEARNPTGAALTNSELDLASHLCTFLNFSGAYGADRTRLQERTLEALEHSLGPNHPHVARELTNLAELLRTTNRATEAEQLAIRALSLDETHFGSTHPNVARSLNNLATLLEERDQLDEAEELYRRAITIFEVALGPNNVALASSLNNLAGLLRRGNRGSDAEALYRRALALDEALLGPNHPNVAATLNNLAELLREEGKHKDAEPMLLRALAIDEAILGPAHPTVAIRLGNLSRVLRTTGRLSEAEPLLKRALAINEASLGPNHPDVATNLSDLAMILLMANRTAEAEPLTRRALAAIEASYGIDHPEVATYLTNLADLLCWTDRCFEAEPFYRRALNIAETSFGVDDPITNTIADSLSACLATIETPSS